MVRRVAEAKNALHYVTLPQPENPANGGLILKAGRLFRLSFFLEPRGTRRLSSQSLLDLRVSRTVLRRELGRVELLLDVLNVLNSTAEEGLATDNLYSPNFGRPTVFTDPRRAMVGMRLQLGRE